MSSWMKTICKLLLICFLWMQLPYRKQWFKTLEEYRTQIGISTLNNYEIHTINLKQELSYYPLEQKIKENKKNTTNEITKQKQQKIYIYNTHQEETYQDGHSVVEGAKYLQSLLEKKGYKVILEERKMSDYLKKYDYTYNESYYASYAYLQDQLKKNQFDLIIDFHRDSIPRTLSVYEKKQKQYAKVMFVIGGSNDNYKSLLQCANTLHAHMEQILPGMMRDVMTRDIAYYNQHVHNQMVLIEVGSDANTFQEVKNSIDVISQGIDLYLKDLLS